MAKVAFSKLNKKIDVESKIVEFEGNEIEVKQYLSIKEKWEMIRNICLDSVETETKFFNPINLEINTALNILYYYTNISFTEKQKEDRMKLYDNVIQSDLLKTIYMNIPEEEYNSILDFVEETIESNERYNFSLMGILENASQSYGSLDLDATKIQEKLNNGEGIELLKEILPMINLA